MAMASIRVGFRLQGINTAETHCPVFSPSTARNGCYHEDISHQAANLTRFTGPWALGSGACMSLGTWPCLAAKLLP